MPPMMIDGVQCYLQGTYVNRGGGSCFFTPTVNVISLRLRIYSQQKQKYTGFFECM